MKEPIGVAICRIEDILNPGSRAFSIGEGAWPLRGFVVRQGHEVFAYVNRCPHAGHPLNMRPNEFLSADRGTILCNSHGAVFDISNGACLAGPCVGQALQSLPVHIADGLVLIEGDSEELARRYA
jgi:nitrite reductase/ring-hydroxylating ferredoxin subunit